MAGQEQAFAPPAAAVTVDLVVLTIRDDELSALWRARHVQMVERQIGTKSGTGGSTGAPYLHRRVPLRYYPLLWELRNWL